MDRYRCGIRSFESFSPPSRRRFLGSCGQIALAAAFGGSALLTSRGADAAGPTYKRPLSDFLSTQGTYCVDDGNGGCYLYVPPAPNFLGWSTIVAGQTHALFAGVDYAGLANAFFGNRFGTTVDGSVMEKSLADGTGEVHVKLFTDRANTWVIDLDVNGDWLAQIAGKPTLFGRRPQDPGEPALSQSTLDVKFINDAPGAPLPDLVQLLNFQFEKVRFIGFTSQGSGPLRAEFGVPDGTPGHCHIRQSGLIGTYAKAAPGSRVGLDAFPAELIELRVVGK